MLIHVGYPESRCRTGVLNSLGASKPFSRREADLFVCFARYHARLPGTHPGRACPVGYYRACQVTYSGARAAGVSAEVCQTG